MKHLNIAILARTIIQALLSMSQRDGELTNEDSQERLEKYIKVLKTISDKDFELL